MRRRCPSITAPALALALAATLVTPRAGLARAEFVTPGDAACCLDLGLRVTLRVDGRGVRSALELSGRELTHLTLDPRDAVRWGVPIVILVTEFRNARMDRLAVSRGNTGVR
jgi:hypothetical protein